MISVQEWSLSTSDLIVSFEGSLQILSIQNQSKKLFPLTLGSIASLSENGKFLAIIEQKDNHIVLKVRDVEIETEDILLEREDMINAYDVSWASDTKKLLFSATVIPSVRNIEIFLFDIAKNEYKKLTSGVDGEQNLNPTWINTNQILYLQTNIHNADAYFVVRNIDTSCETKIPMKFVSSFSISPNKQLLTYTLKNSTMYLSDTAFIFDSLENNSNCS
jgi:hypothetical protein